MLDSPSQHVCIAQPNGSHDSWIEVQTNGQKMTHTFAGTSQPKLLPLDVLQFVFQIARRSK